MKLDFMKVLNTTFACIAILSSIFLITIALVQFGMYLMGKSELYFIPFFILAVSLSGFIFTYEPKE